MFYCGEYYWISICLSYLYIYSVNSFNAIVIENFLPFILNFPKFLVLNFEISMEANLCIILLVISFINHMLSQSFFISRHLNIHLYFLWFQAFFSNFDTFIHMDFILAQVMM